MVQKFLECLGKPSMKGALTAMLIVLSCSPERLSALCSTHVHQVLCFQSFVDPLFSDICRDFSSRGFYHPCQLPSKVAMGNATLTSQVFHARDQEMTLNEKGMGESQSPIYMAKSSFFRGKSLHSCLRALIHPLVRPAFCKDSGGLGGPQQRLLWPYGQLCEKS